MQRKNIIILLIILILFSCDNQIYVIDEVEEKPVIYSLLNLNDTVYSISLTKTFIDEKNIYHLIEDPDKVYYESANIILEGMAGDSCIWSTHFYMTDIVKEPGIFPQTPGHLYFSETVIKEFDEHGYLAGNFRSINSFRLSLEVPNKYYVYSSSIPVFNHNFIKSPKSNTEISLCESNIFKIGVSGWPKPAPHNQINFLIRYLEKLNSNEEIQHKEVEFIVRKKFEPADIPEHELIYPDFFFNKLAANIPEVEDLHYRKFIDFDVILYSADENFNNYRETYEYTSDLSQPPWSNIEGGIGLFSMMFTSRAEGLTIDQKTKDSLAFSPITRHLKFVRW